MPDVKRDPQLVSHRNQQRCEDALFMLGNGEHPDRVAARLGITRDTLDKMLERTR